MATKKMARGSKKRVTRASRASRLQSLGKAFSIEVGKQMTKLLEAQEKLEEKNEQKKILRLKLRILQDFKSRLDDIDSCTFDATNDDVFDSGGGCN